MNFESITSSESNLSSSISIETYSGEDESAAQRYLSELEEDTNSDAIEINDTEIIDALNSSNTSSVPISSIPLFVVPNVDLSSEIQSLEGPKNENKESEILNFGYPYEDTMDEDRVRNSSIIFVEIFDFDFECKNHGLQPFYALRLDQENLFFIGEHYYWKFIRSNYDPKTEFYVSNNNQNKMWIEFSVFKESIPTGTNLNTLAVGILKLFHLDSDSILLTKRFRMVSSTQKESLLLDYQLVKNMIKTHKINSIK